MAFLIIRPLVLWGEHGGVTKFDILQFDIMHISIFPCVLQKMSRNPIFSKSKLRQNLGNQETLHDLNPTILVVRIHQHAEFQDLASMRSPEIARNPEMWSIWINQNLRQKYENQETGQNLIISGGDQDTPAYWISGHSFHKFPKMPGTPKCDPFHLVKTAPKVSTDRNQNWIISGFRNREFFIFNTIKTLS